MLEFRDKLSDDEKKALSKPSLLDTTVRGDAQLMADLEREKRRDDITEEDLLSYIGGRDKWRRGLLRDRYTKEWMPEEDIAYRIDCQQIVFFVELAMLDNGGVVKTRISREASRLICSTSLRVKPVDLLHLIADHPLYMEGDPILYDSVSSVMLSETDDIFYFLIEVIVKDIRCSIGGQVPSNDIDWTHDVIDLDTSVLRETITRDEYYSQLVKAITYGLRYIMLRDAQKTPVEVETRNYDGSRIKGPSHGRTYIPQKYVSLTKEYIRARKDYETGARGGLDRYGKHLKSVEIAGFVRMQAYGEGHKLRRPQFIPGFASSRWESDGIRIINVKP